MGMILSNNSIEYFRSLHSRILQSMARHQVKTPYWFEDEVFFNQYECLRSVWSQTSSIKSACDKFNVSRSSFYQWEKRFVKYGLPGLLFFSDSSRQYPDLEQLCLLAKQQLIIKLTFYRRFRTKKSDLNTSNNTLLSCKPLIIGSNDKRILETIY